MPRSGMLRHRRCHDPDRPRPRHQHILTQHRKRQRRMHRIAKRIEDRRYLRRDSRSMVPDIRHRQDHILGKRPIPVYSDTLRVGAKMPASRQAVPASSANYMPLTADQLSGMHIRHIRAHLHHLTHELMADHQPLRNGRARPCIPFIDMQVGPADAGIEHLDLHIVYAHLGLGYILKPKSWPAFLLHQCLQEIVLTKNALSGLT